MKKFIIFVLGISIAFMGIAQNTVINSQEIKNHEIAQEVKTIDNNTVAKDLRIHSSKGAYSAWFHQPTAIAKYMGKAISSFSSSTMTLFKDTSVLVKFTNKGFEPIWALSAANVIDPAGYIYNYKMQNDEFNINSKYTFDSLAFRALYIRHSAKTIIDTLVIQIQGNSRVFKPFKYGPSSSDMVKQLPAIFHESHTWKVKSTTKYVSFLKTIKIPLDTSYASRDTTINGKLRYFYKTISIATNINTKMWSYVSPPKVSISYISGSTYTPNVDTLIGAKNPILNIFRIKSYEYQKGAKQPFIDGNRSCSYRFTRQQARVSNNNTLFIPSYFYKASYPHEYFDIYAKYSTNNVSIEASKNSNISVAQNQPNPFSGTTSVNYSLSKSAKVNIAVFTIAGSKVMQIEEGVKSAGKHNVEINASDLPAGVYFYTFTADNYSVTKRMIVF